MNLGRKVVAFGMLLGALAQYNPAIAEDTPPAKPPHFLKNTKEVLQNKQEIKKEVIGKKGSKEDTGRYIDQTKFYIDDIDTSDQYRKIIGTKLVGILEDECALAEYKLIDFGEGEELVVICYDGPVDKDNPSWAINLDDVCRAYARVDEFLVIDIRADFITELSKGEVSSRRMSAGSALELTELVGGYLIHNQNRCEDWKRFIQENYGPTGPMN